MLRSAIVERHVLSAPNPSIGSGGAPGAEAEQRLKGGHRLPAAIVPKDELVQVELQLSAADPMIAPDQPLLEIAHGAVRLRHHRLGPSAKLLPHLLSAWAVIAARVP